MLNNVWGIKNGWYKSLTESVLNATAVRCTPPYLPNILKYLSLYNYYYKLNFTPLSLSLSYQLCFFTLLYLNYPSILSPQPIIHTPSTNTYLYLHTLSVNCPRLLLSCSITFWVPSPFIFL